MGFEQGLNPNNLTPEPALMPEIWGVNSSGGRGEKEDVIFKNMDFTDL